MSEMMTVDFQTFFIFSLFCLFSVLCYSLFFKKPKFGCDDDLPPSPPSFPIIGHLHLVFSSLVHKSLQKLSSKYGDFLHLRVFNVRILLVSSASMAHEIFKVQDINVSSRGHVAVDESLLLGSYSFLMAPYGDYWKFMKKLTVTKLLGSQALERSRDVRANELEQLYSNLLDKAMKEESVDIGKEAMKLTNNRICKMMLGKSISEENGEAEKMRSLVTDSLGMMKKAFLSAIFRRPFEKLGISLFKKEIMSVSRRGDELMERILTEYEEKPEDHQGSDMADVLLAAYRDKTAEYQINRNQMKSLVMDLLVGGTDTSAQAIQWTMAEMINNPKILERLREEIDSVVGKSRLIQEADLINLPYLQAVVKEGLRLHTPIPILTRLFRRGCKVRGFNIPKNILLVVNSYAVMRDPNVWEDPEEYKPERFLGSSSRSGQVEEEIRELKYLPFGGGRRACPGSNLAYIVLITAIGMMVQCFDWRIDGDKVNMEEARGALTLSMAHPLQCTPISRNPKHV
ncbi:unnamed protein product [Microthlaspi erraticum]|uniref:Cytochrome P450 n=1 Tax=Microthlaspi erraticum TaxID=1685480 RepID=A0A6D2IIC1_9BRAS|nr:unnamed protein product [Microthlaspi erraticum]